MTILTLVPFTPILTSFPLHTNAVAQECRDDVWSGMCAAATGRQEPQLRSHGTSFSFPFLPLFFSFLALFFSFSSDIVEYHKTHMHALHSAILHITLQQLVDRIPGCLTRYYCVFDFHHLISIT